MKRYALSKTMRQKREYNKLVGFNMIRDKYNDCYERLYDGDRKVSIASLNSDFVNSNKRTKKECGIRMGRMNKYENKWIQEVNEIKKKLNK
jgi:hypothetical protein